MQPIDDARFKPRWSALSAAEKQIESRKMEIYAAMVSDLDTYVGEVVAYLKKIGEYENTLILFSSDNGAEPGRRDLIPPISNEIGKAYDHSLDNLGSATSYVMYGPNWASAGATPFNRHKFTGFEGGTHVPAFVHFPQKVASGTRSDAVGTVMDLLPTFLDIAGAKHPGTTYRGKPVLAPRGVSLLPVFYGKAQEVHAADEVLGWELFGQRSVRQGDWKLVWDNALPEKERRWYLYDISTDLAEQKDLSAGNPEQLRKMLQHWERYDQETGVIY
jgi:arylsulfatase